MSSSLCEAEIAAAPVAAGTRQPFAPRHRAAAPHERAFAGAPDSRMQCRGKRRANSPAAHAGNSCPQAADAPWGRTAAHGGAHTRRLSSASTCAEDEYARNAARRTAGDGAPRT